MIPYTPTDAFDDIQEYDITDLVKGGDTGASNQPVKQLANRTEYLYNRLGGYKDVKEVSGNTSLDVTDANKLIAVTASANVTIVVPEAGNYVPGNRLVFFAAMSGAGGPYWLNVTCVNNILDGSRVVLSIYLYDGEMIEIVAGLTNWKWTAAKGNWDQVGQDDLKRFQPRNSFVANGTAGDLRYQYPRLWNVVGASAVSDSAWFSDIMRYRAMFSAGNGSTNFRRPDMRAMSYRALDLTRGVSVGRLDEISGGYEPDQIKAHSHTAVKPRTDTVGTQYESNKMKNGGDRGLWTGDPYNTGSTGGSENTVKSIGLLPIIYY